MSRRDKKKEDSPIDLHSGKHLDPIKITVEIQPEIFTRGNMVNVFYYGVIDGQRQFLGGAGCYWTEDSETKEDKTLDEPKTLQHFEQAREYIAKHLEDVMENAAGGLVREATEMHGAPGEVIDKQIDSSLDLKAEREKMTERSRLLDKMFKELIDAGMTHEEAVEEHDKRVAALPYDMTWFQDLVCRYAAQAAMRLQGHSFWWVRKDKRWRVDDNMLDRFRFFEVHDKWKNARKIHSALPASATFEDKKQAVEAICGKLPDDLLEALFEFDYKAGEYKWRPVLVASVHAARMLHFDKATMEQAPSLYDLFYELGERVMYRKPPQEVLDRIEQERERRWQLRWERWKA
ncbi:MAG: hypothetical protein ACLGJB_03090 [Blastocatellia bacterium]